MRWRFGNRASSGPRLPPWRAPTASLDWKGMRRALAVCATVLGCSGQPGGSVAPSVVQVTITPQSVNLPFGATQQFKAVVTGSSDHGVSWSADRGTVTADGVYTAPQAEGTWEVTATSATDPAATAKASVIVAATPMILITLEPLAATVRPGGTLRFTAVVSNAPDPGVLWSVSEPAGGTVDASGVYAAPFSEGVYHVVARSRADPTRAAQATISVAAVQKVTVGINPPSVALRTGDKQQFTASVAGTNDVSVMWSTDAGTVDQSGVYTAPAAAGMAHVTVSSHADPNQSATAVVTVVAGTSVVVTIEPQSPIVALGTSQQFTAQVVGTADTRVVWSIQEGAVGGSITNAGLYTPSVAGVWHVVATSAADSSVATSTAVTIPQLDVQVRIDPAELTVAPDQVVKFTAIVTGTSDTRVRWTGDFCCGSAFHDDGTVTAPHADGTYHVFAQSLADRSKNATAKLIVVTPPTVTVTIDPSEVTVIPGDRDRRTFKATVTGTSDTRVTWSLEESGGGTIEDIGLNRIVYTPPSMPGTFHVAATSVADSSKSARATVTVAYADLIDGGAPVISSIRAFALWWGAAADFPSDLQPAMESLLSHLYGSSYRSLTNEYLRGATATLQFAGSLYDKSSPPASSPTNLEVQDAACRALDAAGVTPRTGDMVFIYTSNFPHMSGSVCAWHGDGRCHDVQILLAFIPNAQGVPGCVMGDSGCNRYSEATRSLGLFTGHELAEAMTDPYGHAWKDRNGAEIADTCEYLQSCVSLPSAGVTYQLQALYSNAIHACRF